MYKFWTHKLCKPLWTSLNDKSPSSIHSRLFIVSSCDLHVEDVLATTLSNHSALIRERKKEKEYSEKEQFFNC